MGVSRVMRPSRFLTEIPARYLESHQSYFKNEIEEYPEEGFEIGAAVFHRDFGTGIIQKSYNTSLGLTYDIYFPQTRTTRSLVAKFAKLVPSYSK